VDVADRLEQPRVGSGTLGGGASLGGVEAGPRDAEHPTPGGDRVLGPLRADEAVHRRYLRPVSVAKKAAAFFQDFALLAQLPVLALELCQACPLVGLQALGVA